MKKNNRLKKLSLLTALSILLATSLFGGSISTQAASKYISRKKAISIATKDAKVDQSSKKFKLEDAELDREGKTKVWDIEFRYGTTKYEYDINAKTKRIIKQKKITPKKKTTAKKATYIGLKKAKEIALTHAKSKSTINKSVKYTKAKREKDDGRVIYEIEFRVGGVEYEYEINAKTGKIIEWDIDRD